jgi:hypothetical protein
MVQVRKKPDQDHCLQLTSQRDDQELLQQLTDPQSGRLRIFPSRYNDGIVGTFMFGRPNRLENPVPTAIMSGQFLLVKLIDKGFYFSVNPKYAFLETLVEPLMDVAGAYCEKRGIQSPLINTWNLVRSLHYPDPDDCVIDQNSFQDKPHNGQADSRLHLTSGNLNESPPEEAVMEEMKTIQTIYQCQCEVCTQPEPQPEKEIHQQMNWLLSRLDEQQRRWYVGLEAKKLGLGGVEKLSQMTGISVDTIRLGRQELDNELIESPVPSDRLTETAQPSTEKTNLSQ